jgi:vacuolar protein sorting-associated protein 52
VERIKALRMPNGNVQVIQQTTMLRYRALFHFMLEHHPQLANEIRQAYMNTMRWYYSYHFDRFKRTLEKVQIENRVDMLGNDDSRKGAIFSSKGTAGAGLPGNDPFRLGDRLDILKEGNDLVSMQAKDLEKPVPGPLYLIEAGNS